VAIFGVDFVATNGYIDLVNPDRRTNTMHYLIIIPVLFVASVALSAAITWLVEKLLPANY
jgi:hypothetical protein